MSAENIHVTLQFALVAAVILPLLPNRTIDPLGLLNPFQVWMMVVLVSGIGFSRYVLMKVTGSFSGDQPDGYPGRISQQHGNNDQFFLLQAENILKWLHITPGQLFWPLP